MMSLVHYKYLRRYEYKFNSVGSVLSKNSNTFTLQTYFVKMNYIHIKTKKLKSDNYGTDVNKILTILILIVEKIYK